MTVTVASETPNQPEVATFLAASTAYAQSLYPVESNHLVDLSTLTAANARFLVARREGEAVGCGALILAGDGAAELKRMWVAPKARGLGVGRAILQALERQARRDGVALLRLETGIHQPQAIGLYRSHGFAERPPFGAYAPDPLSLFMEKRLHEGAA